MKLAICNETFVDWHHARAFSFARELGYTGIEIAPFTLGSSAYEISPETRREIKDLAQQNSLEVVGLHWLLAKTQGYYLTTPDAEVRKKTADYLGELARLCRDLGGKIMVLGSPQQRNLLPGVSHAQGMELAADVLKQTVPVLEECGVTIAVEPLDPEEGDFLNEAELGAQVCEMVDSPHVKLHLDVKAMSCETKPIPQIIHEQQKWLVHFHANDPNRRGPGMGKVEFPPILRALQEVGYDGWLSVEVFDYAPGPENLARESIEYLQRCLAEMKATS